jgi:hypothetical protein
MTWLTLYRRLYHDFSPTLISRALVFKRRGIMVTTNRPSIKILKEKEFTWEDLPVREIGK